TAELTEIAAAAAQLPESAPDVYTTVELMEEATTASVLPE
nr:hypothetical protein [Tanacetum cinerariifolium]